MKCFHTFGNGRHKRQEHITLLFEYIISINPNLTGLVRNHEGLRKYRITLRFIQQLTDGSTLRLRW